MRGIRLATQIGLTLLSVNLSMLSAAQVGWAISETVRVPGIDFSVTGPAPYRCLTKREVEEQSRDPVYRSQARWLQENLDWTGRLQTYANCATTCAAVPIEAQAIVELKSFVREYPSNTFFLTTWPNGGNYSVWEEVDSSRVEGNTRFVCAVLNNHGGDIDGYFVVYFEY